MFWTQKRVIATLVSCAVLGNVMTYVLYNYTQKLLKERLQDRIVAIVSTAATHLDPEDVKTVWDENDMDTGAYERLVTQLENVQNANENLLYVYIMRRTRDPNVLEFVADAQGLLTFDEQDFDGDGVVGDDEVVPIPGDPFEIADYPTLKDEAFYHPVAAPELEEDQWSVMLSAYAPIFDDNGDSVAIVGVDVEITDFKMQTRATLMPFMLFIVALILLLTLLTLVIFRFQSERVAIMQELDRQKDELLGMVSHQLATPITSIKWYLEMLLDGDSGKLNKEQRDELQTMQSTSTDLADLVSMILDVSRIQLGRMQIDRVPLKLDSFFDEIVTGIKPMAEKKKVKFTVCKSQGLPVAMFDRRLMRMTLENLLSNAVKYTQSKGEVKLDVVVKNKTLHYTVTDSGCGIPKKEQSRVFSKLFRASNVIKSIDGNGLGLFAAKGAVEAQGGTISFISKEKNGTTFTVELPLETPEKKPKKKS